MGRSGNESWMSRLAMGLRSRPAWTFARFPRKQGPFTGRLAPATLSLPAAAGHIMRGKPLLVASACLTALVVIVGALVLDPGHLSARLRAAPGCCLGGDTAVVDVLVEVDTAAVSRPISPLIYGVAAADGATLRALGATLDRWGGNRTSRYNWVQGRASNAGRDWEFRNVALGASGSAADGSVAEILAAGARPLLTVPALGWVARDVDNRNRSLGVPPSGGPPLSPGSGAIAGYDPAVNQQRTSLPSFARKPGPLQEVRDPSAPAVYQDEWVHHLVDRFGAGPTGVQLFAIDNEPDLWSTTHTDVHPVRMGYDDMLRTFVEYAGAVKSQDRAALVLGPDLSGWTAYFYSDLDRGGDNFATHADRRIHGDEPFLPWWLGQVYKLDRAQGRRTLDYLDVHYYPQAPGVALSDRKDPATQALRIRSTRSLWDPAYRDESWIATPVALIPRLRRWIDQRYPGTGLAITEYNWGGEQEASGAVALAEVLGVFGREGVDLASYWTYPPPQSPAGAAFRLYRNYDGSGSAFGDLSLPTRSNRKQLAAFAARRAGSREVDLVVANESLNDAARVHVRGLPADARATRFCIPPGSGRIEPAPLGDPGQAVVLPPVGVCLLRFTAS